MITALIFSLAAFLRTFRTFDLLRFYYDQGRDAQIIIKIIQDLHPVLVGPTTGLAGILRGPAFYYLLLPGYLIGQGSPAIAALWIQILNLIGIFILYKFIKRSFGQKISLIAICLIGLSYHFVSLSRWLSNPSVIFLSIPLMLFSLQKIYYDEKPHLWYPILALILGLNLQFEIASEIWFIPLIPLLWLLKLLPKPSLKVFFISLFVFLVTLLPQIIFDIRHDGLIRNGILTNFAKGGPSFSYDHQLFPGRLLLFLETFTDLVAENLFFAGFLAAIIAILPPIFIKNYLKNDQSIYYLFLVFPLIILLFYTGNHGNFYKYYLLGTTPIFAIFLAKGMVETWGKPTLKIASIIIIISFLAKNTYLHYNFFRNDLTGESHISLGNQVASIKWIYQDAQGKPFTLRVYVPPVIPYSYDYLLFWLQKKDNLYPPTEDQPLFYALYEVDPDHPDRLKLWLENQGGYGKIQKTLQFGGIHLVKREKNK